MSVWPTVFVFLVIFILIIIIVILLYTTRVIDTPFVSTCTVQSQCSSGYVCNGVNCKGGLGTLCNTTADCATGFNCLSGLCSVILNPTPATSSLAKTPPVAAEKVSEVSSVRRRKTSAPSAPSAASAPSAPSAPSIIDVATEASIVRTELSSRASVRSVASRVPDVFIDGCTFSKFNVYLLQGGTKIKVLNKDQSLDHIAVSTTPLKRLVKYGGYLHALSVDGRLLQLPNEHMPQTVWTWDEPSLGINEANIIHISSTIDSNALWVQTASTGYLVQDGQVVHRTNIDDGYIRVLGNNIDNYINVYPDHIMLYPEDERHDNAKYAISDHNDTLYFLDMDSSYERIVLINWTAVSVPAKMP